MLSISSSNDASTCEASSRYHRSAIENSISFLNQLENAIWHLYHNGRRPELDPATPSVEALVAKNILELREGRTGYIVAETRRCMTLLTQGLSNTAM